MQLAVDFYNFLRMVYQSTYMIRRMIHLDIRARYIGSFLGIFWSIVHPLAKFVIYYFIFSVILKIKLGPEYSGTNFAFWLLAGLLPWLFFAEVLNRAPRSVLDQGILITRSVFPSEILPLAQIGAAMVHHLASRINMVEVEIEKEGYTPWRGMLATDPKTALQHSITLEKEQAMEQ